MEPDQFTLEEANALIPWLTEKFREITMLREQHAAILVRIENSRLDSDNATNSVALKATSEQITRKIEDGIEEILDQGIIVRDVSRGLVDIPSLRNQRDIYLCWIDGEKRVDYWHETNQGFEYRQPL